MDSKESDSKQPVSRLERRLSQREPVLSHDEALDWTESNGCHSYATSSEDSDICNDNADVNNVDDNDSPTSAMNEEFDTFSPVQNAVVAFFNNVYSILKSRIKILQNRHIKVMLMAVVAILALIHSQTGDPVSSLGRLVILWRLFLQRIGLIPKR